MKKLIAPVVLCCALLLPIASAAQQTNSSDAPDRAQVLKFLELMHTRAQMVQTLNELSKQMRSGAEEGFKQKVPNPTPQQLAKVDKLFDGIFSSLPIDEMMDAIVPIYQKHLTKTDLAAISEFYASPAGQKIITEMPAILSESMQAGGEIGQRAFTAKSSEFEKRLEDLINDSEKQDTAPAPK